MKPTWKCPRCGRQFRRANQRHACGIGSREELLKGKPEPLVALYRSLEKSLRSCKGVEIVAKDRYALFRTTRIFADLVFMKDALRLAIHMDREAHHPLFFKVGMGDNGRVGHVAKLHNAAELKAVMPFLKEAYELAWSESA